MIPITPNTLLNPLVSGPLSRQARALRMTVGPTATQSKKRKKNKNKTQQPANLNKKGLRCKPTETLMHAFESR